MLGIIYVGTTLFHYQAFLVFFMIRNNTIKNYKPSRKPAILSILYSGNVDILEYTSGSVFRGICQERKPSKGVYQSVKGDMYIGDNDVDGKFCGFGMYKFANDSLYVGNFYKCLYNVVRIDPNKSSLPSCLSNLLSSRVSRISEHDL